MNDVEHSPDGVENGGLSASWSEMSRFMNTPDCSVTEEDTSSPFLCMRLMCSQNQPEVEAVKAELSRAGIFTETRNNPTAEALGVSGIELWVQHERDFYDAVKLFSRLQSGEQPSYETSAAAALQAEPPALLTRQEPELESEPVSNDERPIEVIEALPASPPEVVSENGEVEPPGSSLQEQILEMFKFEQELVSQCAAVQNTMQRVGKTLANWQAVLGNEVQSRAGTEKALTEEIARLQSALQSEHALHEQALRQAQEKIASQSQTLQAQEAAVLKLKKQLSTLESQWQEEIGTSAKLREDLAKEQEARAGAEERAVIADETQQYLRRELLEQKQVGQAMEAHLTSLNSLYRRLQTK